MESNLKPKRKMWRTKDICNVLDMFRLGSELDQISKEMKRSIRSIRNKISEHVHRLKNVGYSEDEIAKDLNIPIFEVNKFLKRKPDYFSRKRKLIYPEGNIGFETFDLEIDWKKSFHDDFSKILEEIVEIL